MSWIRKTYCLALASLLWLAPVSAQTPQLAPPQYGPNDGARGFNDPGPQPNLTAQPNISAPPNLGQPTLATPQNEDSREYLRLLNQPAAPAAVNPAPANSPAMTPMNVAARPEPAATTPNTQAIYQQPVTTGVPVAPPQNGLAPSAGPVTLPATYTAPLKNEPVKLEAPNNTPRPLGASGAKPLPLAGPNTKSPAAASSWSSFGTMLGSLAIVLGLFVVTIKLLRRGMPGAKQKLGRDVVEVLGQTPLAPRQTLQVIRFGNKILLVAMSPDGCDTLTEITDPLEVDRLAGMCQQTQSNSSTKTFGDMFRQVTSIRPVVSEPESVAPPSDSILDEVRARLRGGSPANREVTHG